MKKIFIFILLLIPILTFSQTVRPPVVTNEAQIENFIWENNLIDRDSLVYFKMVGDTCFQISPVQAVPSWSQKYCFEKRQNVWYDEGDIWLCVGCSYSLNDSIFILRRDPECSNCWQFSYTGTDNWRDLWCESSLQKTLKVVTSSDSILRIGEFGSWSDETGLLGGVSYLGFIRKSANEGKFLQFLDDSVRWGKPVDSIYFNGHWYTLPDSIPVNHDSIFFYNEWYILPDSLPIKNDSFYYAGEWHQLPDTISVINDSVYFKNLNEWAGGGDSVDLFWQRSDSVSAYIGDGIKYNNAVGIGCAPSRYFAKLSISTSDVSSNGISSVSNDGYGVSGYGTLGGVFGIGMEDGVGIKGYCQGSGVSGLFSGGKGLISDIISVGNENVQQYTFPQSTGNKNDIMILDVDSNLYFAPIDSLIDLNKYEFDSIKIGNGPTVSRSGTMMSYDIWFGTQAEWTANTPKNGVYPQATTTFWTIND